MIVFLVMGVIPTAFAFWWDSVFCKYDMNMLCFFECCIPLVIGASLASLVDDED